MHPILYDTFSVISRIGLFLTGAAVVGIALISVIRTLVLPRATNDWISKTLLLVMCRIFALLAHPAKTYEGRDRIMSFLAPLYLLMLTPLWMLLVLLGYMGMFRALRQTSWIESFNLSGSSLLTLGFAPAENFSEMLLAFSEAVVGLILVALLIAYLPTMYNTFSRRESTVTKLAVRAGVPPSTAAMINRMYRIGELAQLDSFWEEWETQFAEIEESHSSLAVLVFFRSPNPELSWITASGMVMDTAAIMLALVDVPKEPKAALCLRAGFLALQRVAQFFDIPFEPEPTYPEQEISITREEFDALCEALNEQGVPLEKNLDEAWAAYAGWRVNYDQVLTRLCALTMAPYTAWSSDRSPVRPV